MSAFNFQIDSFRGKRSREAKNAIIESFDYLDLQGPIVMTTSLENRTVHTFLISEEYTLRRPGEPYIEPKRLFFSRLLAASSRDVVAKYDLKKRFYISTTSMDAELALVTANLALAGRGKVHYDPFTGTGSFPIACAHFGSCVLGSDLDGRSIRGAGKSKGKGATKAERSVRGNFGQYDLLANYLDGFVADLTNTPLRSGRDAVGEGAQVGKAARITGRWLDGVCCDPPYGVREGLKVLGSVKEELQSEVMLKDGRPAHLVEGYIPPKRAYSFEAMLADILSFAFHTLVDGGRLCMWMPTANDEDMELAIPKHPGLRLVASCVQEFNKWSRRLLTWQRLSDGQVDWDEVTKWERNDGLKTGTADELNQFRRKFFEGFKEQQESTMTK